MASQVEALILELQALEKENAELRKHSDALKLRADRDFTAHLDRIVAPSLHRAARAVLKDVDKIAFDPKEVYERLELAGIIEASAERIQELEEKAASPRSQAVAAMQQLGRERNDERMGRSRRSLLAPGPSDDDVDAIVAGRPTAKAEPLSDAEAAARVQQLRTARNGK